MTIKQTTKHTPGPWKAGTLERGRFVVSAPRSNGRAICVMRNTQEQDPEHERNLEADANARLIAAAPDLLNALNDAYECLSDHSGFLQSTTAIKIRAVIAKVEGEP